MTTWCVYISILPYTDYLEENCALRRPTATTITPPTTATATTEVHDKLAPIAAVNMQFPRMNKLEPPETSNLHLIIAVTVGSISLLVAVIAVVAYLRCQKHRRSKFASERLKKTMLAHASQGNTLSLFTNIFYWTCIHCLFLSTTT